MAVDPIELIQQAQYAHNELGPTEEIIYCHVDNTGVYPMAHDGYELRHDNRNVVFEADGDNIEGVTFEEHVKAFISNHEYTDPKTMIRKIEIAFNQVPLLTPPTDRDVIEYRGEEYRVVRWEQQLGFYDIFAETKRRHTGQRMKHQRSGRGVR